MSLLGNIVRSIGSLVGIGSQPQRTAGASPAIQARFDNAFTTDQSARNWWPADYLSAKAANSFSVRRTLRIRSRYEVSNNPRLWGVATNNATDLINTGPTLQCLTGNSATDRLVERLWNDWCAEVNFTQKLITIKLAETVDGEGFLVNKYDNSMEHPVKLWPVDIEADQVTNPMPLDPAQWQTDGIELNPVTGEPKAFHVLKYHPGDYWFGYEMNPLKVERVKAQDICQLFPKFRPGQVRGLPVFTPSLDLFTELRAFRKSTLDAAQTAADHSAVLTTEAPPGVDDGDNDAYDYDFRGVATRRNQMTILPKGMSMAQLKSEHPMANFNEFSEFCTAEAIRPLAYPLNLALGSSQKFNFSSAKLDHINYRNTLTVERVNKIEPQVVEKEFREFIRECVLANLLPRDIRSSRDIKHAWHWPGFESLDPMVDANADQLRLAGGQDSWQDFCARRGMDWETHFQRLSDAQKKIDKLGIVIGEPTKQSVTERVEVDDEGNPLPKKKNPPEKTKAKRVSRIRAGDWDENKHPRADDGKFGTGAGTSAADSPESEKTIKEHSEEATKSNADTNADLDERNSDLREALDRDDVQLIHNGKEFVVMTDEEVGDEIGEGGYTRRNPNTGEWQTLSEKGFEEFDTTPQPEEHMDETVQGLNDLNTIAEQEENARQFNEELEEDGEDYRVVRTRDGEYRVAMVNPLDGEWTALEYDEEAGQYVYTGMTVKQDDKGNWTASRRAKIAARKQKHSTAIANRLAYHDSALEAANVKAINLEQEIAALKASRTKTTINEMDRDEDGLLRKVIVTEVVE